MKQVYSRAGSRGRLSLVPASPSQSLTGSPSSTRYGDHGEDTPYGHNARPGARWIEFPSSKGFTPVASLRRCVNEDVTQAGRGSRRAKGRGGRMPSGRQSENGKLRGGPVSDDDPAAQIDAPSRFLAARWCAAAISEERGIHNFGGYLAYLLYAKERGLRSSDVGAPPLWINVLLRRNREGDAVVYSGTSQTL